MKNGVTSSIVIDDLEVTVGNLPPAAPTEAAILSSLTAAVQIYLDATARERNYDGILSLCSYATSLDLTFKTEGQAGVEWRDAVWRASYTIMAAVKSGIRGIPTVEELIEEMPPMVWP